MSKHTKGPWHVEANNAYHVSYIIRGGQKGNQIAQTFNWQDKGFDICSEANARLIAAAPDLLEALEALLERDQKNTCLHESTHRGGAIWEICDECGEKWSDDRDPKPAWSEPQEWDAARAAIARAKGEQQ